MVPVVLVRKTIMIRFALCGMLWLLMMWFACLGSLWFFARDPRFVIISGLYHWTFANFCWMLKQIFIVFLGCNRFGAGLGA